MIRWFVSRSEVTGELVNLSWLANSKDRFPSGSNDVRNTSSGCLVTRPKPLATNVVLPRLARDHGACARSRRGAIRDTACASDARPLASRLLPNRVTSRRRNMESLVLQPLNSPSLDRRVVTCRRAHILRGGG